MVRVCTTIGREYAVAEALGLGLTDLLTCTRNAIRAAFTTPERQQAPLVELDAWQAAPASGA